MRHRLAIAWALLAVVAGCRCGERPEPRAYDVGVPLEDLPSAQPAALSALVPGPVLLYGEAADGRALSAALLATAPVQALSRDGALQGLALSDSASAVSALAQRLNDLSRSPIGDEAIGDLLEGPLAVGVRAGPKGFDLLLVKALSPRAQGALRLAQMLEAVRPSATELRVERHQGLPVRTLRLQGGRRLSYVVLRDRLLLATDGAWLRQALEVALGLSVPQPPAAASAVRGRAASPAFAVLDATVANRSQRLGGVARALSGLDWVALRWDGHAKLELGVRRTEGTFAAAGAPVALPPNTALALVREASLEELLALPADVPTADGGAPSPSAGRALLERVKGELRPVYAGHVLYAIGRSEPERSGLAHLLALHLRAPGSGLPVMERLAPLLFRPPRPAELTGGLRCAGPAAAICWSEQGAFLALATSPLPLRALQDPSRRSPTLAAGPLSVYVDPSELLQQLATVAPGGSKRRSPASELDPVAQALKTVRPVEAELVAAQGSAEAWGELVAREVRPEPGRDGGGS